MEEVTTSYRRIPGGVLAPRGFVAAGAHAGLKRNPRFRDIGLLCAVRWASAAAVFTTNRVRAAPVIVSERRLRNLKRVRGIVVNSGNANACTGAQGMRDAFRMAAEAEVACGAPRGSFLVASTGVIGRRMPIGKTVAGIRTAAGHLKTGLAAASAFSRAILTTDIRPKTFSVEGPGGAFRIGGCTKGAGMIAPRMATMLAFLTTDAAIPPSDLRPMLKDVADETFNRITVDGHTSTNDSLFLLASGVAGPLKRGMGAAFRQALRVVCQRLADAIVADGEGATKIFRIRIDGAKTVEEAEKVGRAIAESPLVKTAVHGGDPNWGRIVSAAGMCGVPIEPDRITLRIGGIPAYRRGVPVSDRLGSLARVMRREIVEASLDLERGGRSATITTCDLSDEYIRINADYTT